MKKHIFTAFLLTASLLCTGLSLCFADEGEEPTVYKSDIYTYTVSGDSATITGVDDISGGVEVPDTLDGYTVTALGEGAFSASENITAVSLPNTIRSIGSMCFAYSTSIKTVHLSNAITAIEEGTFYQCGALIGITAPYGVRGIGEKAFAMCPNLSSVSIASTVDSIAEDAFLDSPGVKIYCKLSDEPTALSYAQAHDIPYENLITVYVNGIEVDFDQAPITDNRRFRTLVPLRSVLEDMGAKIEWYNDMGYAGINIGDYRLLIKPDSEFMRVNDETVYLSSPAIEYNNRVLLPIRDVVQAVGGKVVWSENSTSVAITYNK